MSRPISAYSASRSAPASSAFASSRPPAIDNLNQIDAHFTAPNVTKPETMHVILAVTDQGTPPLTRYQRVIITIYP